MIPCECEILTRVESMTCPACGSSKFLLRPLRIANLPLLLMFKRPVECYVCRGMFQVPVLRQLVRQIRKRLKAVPKVRLRITAGTAIRPEKRAPEHRVPEHRAQPPAEPPAPMCRLVFLNSSGLTRTPR